MLCFEGQQRPPATARVRPSDVDPWGAVPFAERARGGRGWLAARWLLPRLVLSMNDGRQRQREMTPPLCGPMGASSGVHGTDSGTMSSARHENVNEVGWNRCVSGARGSDGIKGRWNLVEAMAQKGQMEQMGKGT